MSYQAANRPGGNLNVYDQVKETLLKTLPTVGVPLHDTLENETGLTETGD